MEAWPAYNFGIMAYTLLGSSRERFPERPVGCLRMFFPSATSMPPLPMRAILRPSSGCMCWPPNAPSKRVSISLRFPAGTTACQCSSSKSATPVAMISTAVLWALKIGNYEEWGEDAGSSRFRKTNWMRPFVQDVKGIVGSAIPVVSNGRFTNPDDMIEAINGGQCDIIGAAD